MSSDLSYSDDFAVESILTDTNVQGFGNNCMDTRDSSGENPSLANADHNTSSSVTKTEHTTQQQEQPAAASPASEVIAPVRRSAPARQVDHTYRDYSQYKRETYFGIRDEFDRGKKLDSNFPAKLHAILSNPEYAHIISWMPHGRSWKIMHKELLLSAVCSKYFSHSKYQSFTRQVNGWGFKRLQQSGSDFKTYYHECFLRGLPHLTRLMKRVEANQGKLLPDKEGEPNFTSISHSFPVPLYEGAPLVVAEPPPPYLPLYVGALHVVAEPPPPYGHPGCNTSGRDAGSPHHLMSATSAGYPQPPPSGHELQTGSYPPCQPPPAPAYYGGNPGPYPPHAAYGSTPNSSYHHEHAPPGAPYSQHASPYHHQPPPPFSRHQSTPHSPNTAAPAPVGGGYYAPPPPPLSYDYGPPTTPAAAQAGSKSAPDKEYQYDTHGYHGHHYPPPPPYIPDVRAPSATAPHSSHADGNSGGYNPHSYDHTSAGGSGSAVNNLKQEKVENNWGMATTQEQKPDHLRFGSEYQSPSHSPEHQHQHQDYASLSAQPQLFGPATVGGVRLAAAAYVGNKFHVYASTF